MGNHPPFHPQQTKPQIKSCLKGAAIMVTLATIRDNYAATEEKESGFNSTPTYGRFDDNGDYYIPEETLPNDIYLLWC